MTPGPLIIVGGREDKHDEKTILRELVRRCDGGKLVVATVASDVAEDVWKDYEKVFHELGVKDVVHLDVNSIEEARDPEHLKLIEGAALVYFTGGDQLKITTRLGGTPLLDKIMELHNAGAVIAGTSAGASVMSATMLTGGENDDSHKVGNWMMAPGLGLTKEMIIDQHFAQRGRIGRLLGAVALNPGLLCVGIDEDTSIIVTETGFEVFGSNAVYILDGREVLKTNITEAPRDSIMTIYGVKLHVLGHGDVFDFGMRQPLIEGSQAQAQMQVQAEKNGNAQGSAH